MKVGTMPGQVFRICRKRKPPVIGELFFFKEDGHGTKEERVRLLEIREVHGQQLYVVERF